MMARLMSKSHTRIDDGIKKGPRPRHNRRGDPQAASDEVDSQKQQPMLLGASNKLSKADPKQVLERYLNGESSTQIAASYNCTRQGLGYFLRQTAPDPWREAQIVLAVERKEQAEDEIASAGDPLSLARAREQLRGAQWDLERVFNRIYGQKQEVTHVVQPVLTINTQPVPGTVIDAEVVAETPNGAALLPVRPSEQSR